MDATTTEPRGRPMAGLLTDLWRQTSTLVREETALAKAEISEKVSQAESGAVSLAVGGAIVYAGFLVLLVAACVGLAQALPSDQAGWLSPLIIGIVVAVIGIIVLAIGRSKLKADNLKPSRTVRSLRRDGQFAKEQWQ